MQFHWSQIVSSIVLLLGTAMVLIAVCTSYWNYYHFQTKLSSAVINTNRTGHRGLWQTCSDNHVAVLQGTQDCISRFSNFDQIFANKQLFQQTAQQFYVKGWEVATLVLMSLSVAFGFGSLLTAPLCCNSCGCVHAVFVFMASVSSIIGIIVYTAFQLKTAMSEGTEYMKFDSFGWSYIMAIIGTVIQLIAAIAFAASSRVSKSAGYSRGSRE